MSPSSSGYVIVFEAFAAAAATTSMIAIGAMCQSESKNVKKKERYLNVI